MLHAVGVLWIAVVACVPVARAQEVAAYLGLGGANDSSNGLKVDTFGDGRLHDAPGLNGVFAELGASVFINQHAGVGAELSWKPSQSDYAGLQYRASFYSFDGIFRPEWKRTKRFESEFRAGIGGARLRYSFDTQDSCDRVPGCPDSTHFQVHLAAAGRIYLKDHVFVRPAVDVHYVNHFSEFGSNWVPQYSVGIGYGFGR
jgi:hypothetical protein